MKYLLSLMLLASGCTHKPKYRVGDCEGMSAMAITEKGEWDSSGFSLGEMQIVEIIHTEKINRYMAYRLHAKDFYKIRIFAHVSFI